MIHQTLSKIQNNELLCQSEMEDVMSSIMLGEWSNEQIAAFLMGLSVRGESIDEIAGAAQVMRNNALPINAPEGAIDCCGTGGDGVGSYNISTAVAIVAAACGVPVAKHGNRSASSKSGAADVLESLGVNLDVSQEKLEEALSRSNFAFLMAPRHHAAMKYVVPVRKALGVRTIFNVLGPLSNPAKTKFQLIGVYDRELVRPICEVIKRLGTKSAWVVHGGDGLDEITTTTKTYAAILKDDVISEEVLYPSDFGVSVASANDLLGGDPNENAQALKDVLKGCDNAYADIVVVNTAAVLLIAGKASAMIEAAEMARSVLKNGKALDLLNQYKTFIKV